MNDKIKIFFIKLFKNIKNKLLYLKDLRRIKQLARETSKIVEEHMATHKNKYCSYCGFDINDKNLHYAEYDLDDDTVSYQCKDCNDKENKLIEERDCIFKEHCPRHKSNALYCECCDEYLGESHKTCYMDNVEPHNTKEKYYLEKKY